MSTATLPDRPGTYMQKSDDWGDHYRTFVPTQLLRDPGVPWDAKAVYGWVASHKELTFELDVAAIAAAGPCGRDHAYQALRALEEHGYLTRHRYRATGGAGTVTIWTLHAVPVPVEQRTWKPPRAKARPNGLAERNDQAPEFLTAPEPRRSPDEPAGQPGVPDRAGTPASPAPGSPDRAVPDRAGVPYKEEVDISSGDQKTSLSLLGSEPAVNARAREDRASERAAPPAEEPSEQAMQVILSLHWPGWARRLGKAHAAELAALVDDAVNGGYSWHEITQHAAHVLAEAQRNPLSYLRRGLHPDQLPIPRQRRVLPQHQPDQSGQSVAPPPGADNSPKADPGHIAAIRAQMGIPRGDRYAALTGGKPANWPVRVKPNKWAAGRPDTERQLVAS